ncbi:MAG TPA: type II toxin-antitoxin system VapC family toxin [Solirubrobacterales bacterium]|jgi:PIN domain nuclease of toxin-antitoxin system|nr:type II toxin-antitoxin system VapC family toxin [Solirubrobacterales bacterium]
MLIDSNALLWFVAGDSKRIGRALRAQIEAEATTVSVASLWEIAIKVALGKLDAPDDLPARVEQLGFHLLPVNADHAWRVRRLPRHHRDPFDRLLIAQAQVERLPIITADSMFDAYDVTVVWG